MNIAPTSRLALSAILFGAVLAAQASTPIQWTVTGSIGEPSEISGLELADSGHGVIVTDEAEFLQPVSASGTTLMVGAKLGLPEQGNSRENDLEAVAADGTFFYAIGSHGMSRGSAKFRRDRFRLFRLRYDRANDALTLAGESSLRTMLQNQLGDYAEKPLQRNGVNIEALAHRDGDLYAGFRGPSVDGKAPVLQFSASKAFTDPDAAFRATHWIELGEGIGIRGMTAVPEGFLILTGDAAVTAEPDDDHENIFETGAPFTVRFWDGVSNAAQQVMTVSTTADQKAETISYLGTKDSKFWRVLILLEGSPNGVPTEWLIDKPF